jgi:SagB-type dehydrogenase family enzyme
MRPDIMAYHQATKHSPESIRRSGRPMDWTNRPSPFKRYQEELEEVALPRPRPALGMPALDAIAGSAAAIPAALDIDLLARILNYGAGVMRKLAGDQGPVLYFRTYASAGGLYPIEAYLVTSGLAGLSAGVYHFHPLRHALRRLRDGDWRAWLVQATGAEEAVADAPAVVVLTGMPWRTAWKYADRGFRHLYWDAGMITANLLALAAAAGLPSRVIHGYADEMVETLLGLDGLSEFPVCLIALGAASPAASPASVPLPLSIRRSSLSRNEILDPAIVQAEATGRFADPAEAAQWRRTAAGAGSPARDPAGATAQREGPVDAPRDPTETVIRRRGSARAFDREPIPRSALASILDRATRGVSSDLWPDGSRAVTPYLIANRVEGLEPGAYAWADGFQLLGCGDFSEQAAFLCLEQWLGGDAAATHFLMADLNRLIAALGDRAYRVAQLEAGVLAGRIYLGAYAYRFGATGLTFFDDAVTEFFVPATSGSRLSCLLVTAVGRATRRLLPLA